MRAKIGVKGIVPTASTAVQLGHKVDFVVS